jgi:hypothetical protein
MALNPTPNGLAYTLSIKLPNASPGSTTLTVTDVLLDTATGDVVFHTGCTGCADAFSVASKDETWQVNIDGQSVRCSNGVCGMKQMKLAMNANISVRSPEVSFAQYQALPSPRYEPSPCPFFTSDVCSA